MLRPVLAVVLGLSAVGPAAAQGHDSVFGAFFSRVTGTAQAAPAEGTGRVTGARASDAREREARDMRRGYWERERARLAGQVASRTDAAPSP